MVAKHQTYGDSDAPRGFTLMPRHLLEEWIKSALPGRLKVMLYLWNHAAWSPKTVYHNQTGEPVKIKVGQVYISMRNLAKNTGLTRNKAWRAINWAKARQYVRHQTRQGMSLITVCGFEHWQDYKNYSRTANVTANVTKSGQPRDINNTPTKVGVGEGNISRFKRRGNMPDEKRIEKIQTKIDAGKELTKTEKTEYNLFWAGKIREE